MVFVFYGGRGQGRSHVCSAVRGASGVEHGVKKFALFIGLLVAPSTHNLQ